ncbi:branched-chain amino acid ABC transporter permease [Thermoproteota archaeon]
MVTNKQNKWNISSKNGILLFFLILALAFPLISSDNYILGISISANIGAVYAASWDLISGVTGQFSFGHALFFGVASYLSGYLNLFFGLPPWLSIPLGGTFGVLVGFIVGLPSLRIKGPYFRIVSLIFPVILAAFIFTFPEITGNKYGGLSGLSQISNNIVITYYASLVLLLVSIYILLRILSSGIGLVFRSIREDEDVAEATGINTTKYKLLAWSISGFFAGIAGGFHIHQIGAIDPSIFGVFYSFQAVLWAVLGGIGTIIGSVLGSYIMRILNEFLRQIVDLRALVFAASMIFVYLFLPMGIYRWLATRYNIQIGTWDQLKKLRSKK